MRTYSELIEIPSFIERFRYLKIGGSVGEETFGFDRYLNQVLYGSAEWKHTRREIMARDLGCDMALEDRPIAGRIYIHHMNPISKVDLMARSDKILDPEYLVCVSFDTHNAIHYGDENLLNINRIPVTRVPNDTCLWKR